MTVQTIADRYELQEVIASGGMATVWRARDTRLNRPVAVKRPHPRPPGDDSTERMSREAAAAAALNHPGLVTVYDFGVDGSGPYMVMELVEGQTLQDTTGLTPSDVIDIGARLADGLAAIHEAGIVHRDVKPANVIMSSHGPLLTDFGIALDPTATDQMTDPGKVVATPSYAAPEVLRGDPATPSSDVYSLAVMIDELIQQSGTEPGGAIADTLAVARSDSAADRPSAMSLGETLRGGAPTATGLPVGGSTLVMEAMPTDRAGRDGDDDRRTPRWLWVTGVLILVAAGLTVMGLAMAGDDPPADAAPAEVPVSTGMVPDTTTSTTTTTTATSTTTTTTSTTTTTTTVGGAVGEAAARLESILLEPPRSDLNPGEVEDIMKNVDEAIEAAVEGDPEKARKKLSEVAKRLEEKLNDDQVDEAMTALEDLAAFLGVEVDEPARDDEEDEGD